ncbi:SiaB family protein kinase [Reichenbachiella ulvae]|uniref:SiaB family protein kinase n=1 Tax=Reichenbachiella ulvae TaxID=2980104 RepID=A0ABT3CS26_9BACT|nr:SiaB family protein kinase [Reichenbachiella ulvae]MCV9386444.1 SiaB family protein kinase [Reichenbachiella ulvae]
MDLLKKYKNIYDTNILLMYKGEVTFDLVTSIIETLDGRIGEIESDRLIKKKFYGAATECIQNLYHHMDEVSDENIDTYDSKAGLLMVTARKKFFNIMTGNFIPNDKINGIKAKIDNINTLEKEELKKLYKEILYNEEFSDKGTAGLGFVEIARKTGQKLSYEFHKVNDEYSYFTLQIRVSRLKKEELAEA